MNFRLCTALAGLICVTLVSCYPYHEVDYRRHARGGPDKTVAAADQTKAKKEAEQKQAAQEQVKPTQETPAQNDVAENPGTVTPPQETTKPAEPKRSDYAFANKVPGKEGFVFSPYNSKVVDVRDIPSGTLVQDPTYPASEKKFFRVP